MTSRLKAFMFNTPLSYNELRAVKQVQDLKPNHVQAIPLALQDTTPVTEPPADHVHVTFRKTGVVQNSPPYLVGGVGGLLALSVGILQALKVPQTLYYEPSLHERVEFQHWGLWFKGEPLPSRGYDLRAYEAGNLKTYLKVRRKAEAFWEAWPWAKKTTAHVLERQYQDTRFMDLYAEELPDGRQRYKRVMQTPRGEKPQFTAIYTPEGRLDSLTHMLDHAASPAAAELTLNAENPLSPSVLSIHEGGDDQSTFALNAHQRPKYFERQWKEGKTSYHFKVVPLPEYQDRRPEAGDRSPPFQERVHIFKQDKGHWHPVSWDALSPEHQAQLEHPLLFHQLLPTEAERRLLDLEAHIPQAFKRSVSLDRLSLPVVQVSRPWKQWLVIPLLYAGMGSVGALLIQRFLWSGHSPFARWLNQHVEIHNESYHHALLHPDKTQDNIVNPHSSSHIIYVKDTGNEQADVSIGKALRMLSNFGIIKASVVQHHDSKPPAVEIPPRVPAPLESVPNEETVN